MRTEVFPYIFIKIKDIRTRTGSLIGGDDHSLYTHQEESLYVDLSLVRLGLLRLNFMMESCPPGSLPDPQFLNTLLTLVCSICFFFVKFMYFLSNFILKYIKYLYFRI